MVRRRVLRRNISCHKCKVSAVASSFWMALTADFPVRLSFQPASRASYHWEDRPSVASATRSPKREAISMNVTPCSM